MNKIKRLGDALAQNWLTVVIIMVGVMMLFVCFVMFSWGYGYWSNALAGTHFELGSCWQGIGVVATGLGSVAALAKAAWTKYGADSQYNSRAGERPYGALPEEGIERSNNIGKS